MIGNVLDNRYEVLQKVGEGGMATVYRGRHATLDRDVAIKVLHPHLSSSTRNRERFAREARAIEHLRHDSILSIFDYSGMDQSDYCYIITEFVEGETLSEWVGRSVRLPSEIVVVMGLHLASALSYAHAEGILHRDLKPDNVMVRFDGTVKLMDFGIARFLDEVQVTMTGALVGSPAFMSPEQAKEMPLDPRSDLFSLGTVLFYLTTGCLPFSGSNPSLILKNVIEGNRPTVTELCPSVSSGLSDVIEGLMATDPSERFQSAGEVERALLGALDEVGLERSNPLLRLSAALNDTPAAERELESYLRSALFTRGQAYLAEGESLTALRMFNRLLAYDGENEEVLALVQGLHTPPPGKTRVLWPVALGAFALAAMGASAVFWTTSIREQQEQSETRGVTLAEVEPAVASEPSGAGALQPQATPKEEPDATSKPTKKPPERIVPAAPDLPRSPTKAVDRALVPPTTERADPAPPVVVALDAAVEQDPAMLRIRSGDLPADIYLNGERIGSTRDPRAMRLPPGNYDLEIRSSHVLPATVRVFLEPGEVLEKEVVLQPKPATVRFDSLLSGDCVVSLDGASLGALDALGRRILVRNPSEAHTIRVDCATGTREMSYAFVPLETVFPPFE